MSRKERLLTEAVERYLELCRGNGDGVCEDGEHADNCPFEQRPCVSHSGGLCHWCQLDAALSGVDYRTIEAAASQPSSERENTMNPDLTPEWLESVGFRYRRATCPEYVL